MDHFDLIINFIRWRGHSWSRIHTERCRNSVPTCLLPSQHAGKYARTLAQVGVCFSQLGGAQKRQALISILIKQFNKVQKSIKIFSDNTITCNNWLPNCSIKRHRQEGNRKMAKTFYIFNKGLTYCTQTLSFLINHKHVITEKNVTTIKSLQSLLLHSLVPLASLKSNLRGQN